MNGLIGLGIFGNGWSTFIGYHGLSGADRDSEDRADAGHPQSLNINNTGTATGKLKSGFISVNSTYTCKPRGHKARPLRARAAKGKGDGYGPLFAQGPPGGPRREG